jgi:hypothetical protein
MSQQLTRARRRSFRVLGSLLLATTGLVAVGACTKLTEYQGVTNRYGAVNIHGKATSATAATARATATFFDAITAAIPNSTAQEKDVCQYAEFDSLPSEARGQNQAGDAIGLSIAGASVSIPYEAANLRYATPTASRFSYAAGNVAQATIPGLTNVYPGASISVKLAEPILPGLITAPGVNAPIPVTWNGTNDSTAVVNVSLRYRVGSGTNVAMEQIICSARDDGAFEIPSSALQAFRVAPVETRTLSLTRFRTNFAELDDHTVLFIGSSIDTVFALR